MERAKIGTSGYPVNGDFFPSQLLLRIHCFVDSFFDTPANSE
jgi:hypothetical protein